MVFDTQRRHRSGAEKFIAIVRRERSFISLSRIGTGENSPVSADETPIRPFAFRLLGAVFFGENHFLRSLGLRAAVVRNPRRSVRKSRLSRQS